MTLIVTQAGLDKAIQADLAGISLMIAEVGIGTNGYTPDKAMTALQNEILRKVLTGGKPVSPNQIQLQVLIDDDGEIIGREIGFYLDDGTLFAIDSDPVNIITYKSASPGSQALETFDLVLDSVPPDTVTVTLNGDLSFHEDNANPHPQYEFANNNASDSDIDAASTAAKHVKLAQYWRGMNKKISASEAKAQFLPWRATRTYKTGETCTIEVGGEVIAMQMYAGPHLTCINKDPANLTHRHEQWADAANPFWWIPYTGTEVGMPFWWLDTTPPESAIMEINADLPTAVYWRLARRYPALITGDTINTGEIRGEFLRVLDQGRGVDAGRLIGSAQEAEIIAHKHRLPLGNPAATPIEDIIAVPGLNPSINNDNGTLSDNGFGKYIGSETSEGGDETRPRNIARAMAITI